MAENSAIWFGSTLGDAASITGWKGAYSDTDISDIHSLLLGNYENNGFVIPGYLNNLAVTADTPPSMDVLVNTGAAILGGKIYENTVQAPLTIGANASGNPRIDRIILRVDYTAQTIRAVVLPGIPDAVPTLPALTHTALIHEVSLAYIWVANAAASIAETEIHTEILFATTFSAINDCYGTNNLLINSEFMAFSELSTAAPTTSPPDYWGLVATPAAINSFTRPNQMSRGRAIQLTTNAANEGIYQTRSVKASTIYSIKLLSWVTASDVASIVVTTNSAAPVTITRYIRRTAEWIEETIYYITEADASNMTISLLGLNNGDIVLFGQTLLIEGFYPGPFRQIREILLFTEFVADAVNWGTDGASVAKSTSTTDINLFSDLGPASYGGVILRDILNIYLMLRINDSGSAGGSAYARVRKLFFSDYLITNTISGEPNDTICVCLGWIPMPPRFFTAQIVYDILATGVATLDIQALILGIEI